MQNLLTRMFPSAKAPELDRDEALTGLPAHDAKVEKGIVPLNVRIDSAEKTVANCKLALRDAESALLAAKYAKSKFITDCDRERERLERAIVAGCDPQIDDAISFLRDEVEGLGKTLDYREGRVFVGTSEPWKENVFTWMPICVNGDEVDNRARQIREAIRQLERLKLQDVHDVRASIERIVSEI